MCWLCGQAAWFMSQLPPGSVTPENVSSELRFRHLCSRNNDSAYLSG